MGGEAGQGRRVEALLARGAREEAEAALQAVGREEMVEDPYLRLLAVWHHERREGPGHVTGALEGWSPPPDGAPDAARCRAMEAALRASEALRRGDTADLLRHASRSAEALPADAPWLAFVVAAVLQAAYRMTGDARVGRRALRLCERVGDRADLPGLAVQARALGGTVHMLQGRLHRADDLLEASLELARSSGLDSAPERAMALQFRGYLRAEWNRLDEARDLLLQAAALGEEMESRGVLGGCWRMLMEVELAAGDAGEARRWLERLEALMEGPRTDRNREWLAAVRARYLAATGDLRAAADIVRARGWRPSELAAEAPSVLLARLGEMSRLLDVLGALERWSEVAALAGSLQVVAGEAGRLWFSVRAGAWEATALEARGRAGEADAVLDRLLPTVEAEGYVRVLADLGAHLLPALERAAARRPASGHMGRVLEATRLQGRERRPRPSLTPREAEVLGLLARGASTRAIAGELGVAAATVKTHLHHLYRKLEVGSRTEALARAESLALL